MISDRDSEKSLCTRKKGNEEAFLLQARPGSSATAKI